MPSLLAAFTYHYRTAIIRKVYLDTYANHSDRNTLWEMVLVVANEILRAR
jgi:hypothetical protein